MVKKLHSPKSLKNTFVQASESETVAQWNKRVTQWNNTANLH